MFEKRIVGDYEIIHEIEIGDREIVVGENQQDKDGKRYMTAYCQHNDLFSLYNEVLVGDDYAEIIFHFGERIKKQAEKTIAEQKALHLGEIDNSPFTAKNCTAITQDDDLNGKVFVIRPDILRREYRRATEQLMLCEGGFGASPHSRGSAVYGKNLFNGVTSKYRRSDILGCIDSDKLPEWAKKSLNDEKTITTLKIINRGER